MKHFVFLTLACALGPLASAQQSNDNSGEDPVLLTAGERTALNARLSQQVTPASSAGGEVFIRQEGDGNLAQVSTRGVGGGSSSITILQGGPGASNNLGSLDIVGADNLINVTQDGSRNKYGGVIAGDQVTLTVLQRGNNNAITQETLLDSGAVIELNQFGDNNILDADGYDQSIKVEQYGNAKATLREIVPTSPR